MTPPKNILKTGEYNQPHAFESDQEARLFFAYQEAMEYIEAMTNEKATGKTDEEIEGTLSFNGTDEEIQSALSKNWIILNGVKYCRENHMQKLTQDFIDKLIADGKLIDVAERQSTVIPESLKECRLTESEEIRLAEIENSYNIIKRTQEIVLEKFALFLGKAGEGLPTYVNLLSTVEIEKEPLTHSPVSRDIYIYLTSCASAALAAKEEQHRKEIEQWKSALAKEHGESFCIRLEGRQFAGWLDKTIEPEQPDHFSKLFDLWQQNKNREGE